VINNIFLLAILSRLYMLRAERSELSVCRESLSSDRTPYDSPTLLLQWCEIVYGALRGDGCILYTFDM